VIDVAWFLDRFGDVLSQEVQFFDFNGDGGINIVDVAELLAETRRRLPVPTPLGAAFPPLSLAPKVSPATSTVS